MIFFDHSKEDSKIRKIIFCLEANYVYNCLSLKRLHKSHIRNHKRYSHGKLDGKVRFDSFHDENLQFRFAYFEYCL